MQAGLLNEIIKIYRPKISNSQYGEDIQDYRLYSEIRARVKNDSGQKSVENNEVIYSYTKTFLVRIYEDVKETDIIEYDDKRFQIITIDTDKKSQSKIIIGELMQQ